MNLKCCDSAVEFKIFGGGAPARTVLGESVESTVEL